MKAVAMVQHPRLARWEVCAFRRVRNLRKTNKELHCVGSNSEGKFATTTIYPLHFHQRVDHLWALRQKHRRSAPVLAPIAAAMAAVSADAEPRPRACLSMSGWDWLNTIGHAAGVDGSGVHRPLFQWVLSHSILQNESRGYPITLESSLGLLHCCAMCPDRRSEDSIRLSLSSIRTSINTENHITEK